MTGTEIIKSALRLSGVIAAGETPSASDAADALVVLNQMIDSWNAEKLYLYTLSRQTFALTYGVQAYTIGTGGTFNVSRPARIESAGIVSSGGTEYPLKLYTDREWAQISDKTVQGDVPEGLWDNGGYPLRTLTLYPKPGTGHTLALYTPTSLNSAMVAGTDYTFPEGYLQAIRYNLAELISLEFGEEPSPSLVEIARQSKSVIKAKNIQPLIAKCDEALLSPGTCDIYSGRSY